MVQRRDPANHPVVARVIRSIKRGRMDVAKGEPKMSTNGAYVVLPLMLKVRGEAAMVYLATPTPTQRESFGPGVIATVQSSHGSNKTIKMAVAQAEDEDFMLGSVIDWLDVVEGTLESLVTGANFVELGGEEIPGLGPSRLMDIYDVCHRAASRGRMVEGRCFVCMDDWLEIKYESKPEAKEDSKRRGWERFKQTVRGLGLVYDERYIDHDGGRQSRTQESQGMIHCLEMDFEAVSDLSEKLDELRARFGGRKRAYDLPGSRQVLESMMRAAER